jgi:hypothetical protein
MLKKLMPSPLFALAAVAVSAAASFRLWRQLRRERAFFRGYAAQVTPLAIAAGATEEEVAALWGGPFDWTMIMNGGNTQGGIFQNIKLCPGHRCYNVATNIIPLNAVPNPAAVPGMLAYPQDPPPRDVCPGNCVHIKTHRWQGWMVMLNLNTGAVQLNCHSFAQYECVEPAGANPPPPKPHPPPKPGDVEP